MRADGDRARGTGAAAESAGSGSATEAAQGPAKPRSGLPPRQTNIAPDPTPDLQNTSGSVGTAEGAGFLPVGTGAAGGFGGRGMRGMGGVGGGMMGANARASAAMNRRIRTVIATMAAGLASREE